jgi:rhodanese-related sulfurtransferase
MCIVIWLYIHNMKTQAVQASFISPRDLHVLLQRAPDCCLIDVRTAPEYSSAHVPQAKLLPLHEITPERVAQLRGSNGNPVYLICQSGMRAEKAAEKLSRSDFPGVVVVAGGLDAWTNAGLDAERGTSKVLPLMRQVQLVIGISTAAGAILALTVDPLFALIPLVTGSGLTINGLTGFCGLALLMARLPWNRRTACQPGNCC